MQANLQRPAAAPVRVIARVRAALVLAFLGLVGCATALAARPEFSKAPAPDWVEPVALPAQYELPSGQISGGVYYLLSDSQLRIEAGQKVGFRRFAIRTLTAEGVQDSANIEIPFDPSFQTLTLHTIHLIRDGRTIEKLSGAAVRILQREQSLESLIYDGSKTANIFLDDVRVGDVVDYSYSLAGSNPVFGDRHFGNFQLRWASPLELRTVRLLVPEGRKFTLKPRNGAPLPRPVLRGGYQEYRIRLAKLPALLVEKDAPSWYQPYPSIDWTEFADWNAVARWAAPLYRQSEPLSPALQAEVARIRAASLDDAGRMLAVLKFVQDEVRYLGVEIGPGSHAPSMPNRVFERRFGDCKDKTLLTLVLLDALGIQARPALVNSSELRAIRQAAPRPDVFDHVIVRAEIAGQAYWLDPTRATQRGTAATLFQPDFEVALIVDPSSTGLVSTRVPATSGARKSVHALIDASAGFDAAATLTITTRASGGSAERLRNALATSNREELQKSYLNYYAGYYPGITVAAPMTSSDDGPGNQLTMVEHYRIEKFWPRSKTEPRLEASIHAPEMEDLLKESASLNRRSPLALEFPFDFTLDTEVLLPEEWTIEPETIRVDDAAFEFSRVISAEPKRLRLVDRYRSLKDHVPATAIAAHAEQLGLARENLGYTLSINAPGEAAPAGGFAQRFNWPLAMLTVVLLLGLSAIARRIYRYDPPPLAPAVRDPALTGLGGWLVLVAIGLVILPIRVLLQAIESFPAFAADNWARLTVHGNPDFHPLWAPAMLFDLVLILGQGVGIVLLLALFFKKRRSTPRIYIGFVLLSLVGATISTLSVSFLPGLEVTKQDWMDLVRAAIAAAIWCPYWLLSRRVRATFTRGWRDPPEAATPVAPPAPLRAPASEPSAAAEATV